MSSFDIVEEISAPTFVNACGPWAGKVVDIFARRSLKPSSISALPVKARKRNVFMFHRKPTEGSSAGVTADGEGHPSPRISPLVIDPSGVWFRSEGTDGNFICGMSPLEVGSPLADPQNGNYLDADGNNILTHDPDCESAETLQKPDHALFDEFIWPVLFERVPAFGDLKLKSAWAGFYEYNTFDQVSIRCALSVPQGMFVVCVVKTWCLRFLWLDPTLERDNRSAPGYPQPDAVQRLLRTRAAAVSRCGESHRGAGDGEALPDD